MVNTSSTLRSQLQAQGYVLVPGVVPRDHLDAVIADIWQHTGADPSDRASWYRPGIVAPSGMVEMYHYPSMWNNRQHPRVHQTFADLLDTDRLWVTIDRVNLKPPADAEHPQYDHKGFLHWDTDITRYPDIPFHLQGVLALTDTDENMGGFQCLPDLYGNLKEWLASQQADADLRRPDFSAYTATKVPMKAGDMVIWSTLLPHGNGHNVSEQPRLAQYISMFIPTEADEADRQDRVDRWQKRLPPPHAAFPGDPRKIEENAGTPADLTPLGRKLLGLDSW